MPETGLAGFLGVGRQGSGLGVLAAAPGFFRAVLEADAPRVSCPEHGVLVAAVPWARHRAGHTRFVDDQVAWLAVQCSRTAVCELMRIA